MSDSPTQEHEVVRALDAAYYTSESIYQKERSELLPGPGSTPAISLRSLTPEITSVL